MLDKSKNISNIRSTSKSKGTGKGKGKGKGNGKTKVSKTREFRNVLHTNNQAVECRNSK